VIRELRAAFAALVLLAAAESRAQVTAYEWVTQGGRNNVVDSNAASCDNSPFDPGTGVWSLPGQGCYNRTGALCSADPSRTCDLQLVPKGRCTSGSLSATGGPGGTNTCVWPHGAGRCAGNAHVGCVTDSYLATGTPGTGPSSMCTGTGNSTCDMTTDPYGGPFRSDCACDGENPAAANFEVAVCRGAQPLCSDGDPDRDRGGYGLALGIELNLGSVNVTFPNLGPAVNGSATPSTSPRYPLENPPSVFELQRDAGSIGRGNTGAVHRGRTTEAREPAALAPTLGVVALWSKSDSYWSDWTFESQPVTGTFNTHTALLACDPPVGWSTDQKLDPTPSAPNSGDEAYCSQLGRDSVAIGWQRDLTAAERAANPACPPSCGTDFDLTTTELEAISSVAALDANAGLQLAVQSGEGRPAGFGTVISATPLTLVELLNANDARCRLGGWGDAAGFIGRCSDGPTACVPGDPANGDSLCTGQGGQCRACNGPIDPANADLANGQPNALGLPPGYDTHGLPELDLVAGQRIGVVAGVSILVRLPLFLVGTSGYAAADFRDLPNEAGSTLDLADLGAVDPAGAPFAVGIGTGGSFANGVTLPIGASCCANEADVSWAPAQVGSPVSSFARTFDTGPGPDGIPGCMGDTPQGSNGIDACNQRLGVGNVGAKTDGAFDTGLDDVAQTFPVGASGTIPASSSRFLAEWHGPPCGFPYPTDPNVPVFNVTSAVAFRDATVFGPRNADGLLKLNMSLCPIINGSYDCGFVENDYPDCDGIPSVLDDCPTIFNPDQFDSDSDGVGDACDNCVNRSNPRVTSLFLASNQWATLTGDQRDDDHDGYGNKCDGKFPGVTTAVVGAQDLAQFRASTGKSRTGDTCGTTGTRPCAIFDLDENVSIVGAGDLAQFRTLNGKLPGPKCAACPLPCTAGTAGSCGPIP